MNVLLIFPTFDMKYNPICYWNSRLTHKDRLFIMNLRGLTPRQIYGTDVHSLEIDLTKLRYLRPIILRALRHWLNLVQPLRKLVLRVIWSDFLFNVRSFDPDVIDLRWMPDSMMLKAKLTSDPNRFFVLSEKNSPLTGKIDTSWRQYNPNIKTSIVLPVYNGAKYLHQSIEYCLQQSHWNIELVIVDDCSTDETPNIIAKYSRQDPRIKTIRNETNLHFFIILIFCS